MSLVNCMKRKLGAGITEAAANQRASRSKCGRLEVSNNQPKPVAPGQGRFKKNTKKIAGKENAEVCGGLELMVSVVPAATAKPVGSRRASTKPDHLRPGPSRRPVTRPVLDNHENGPSKEEVTGPGLSKRETIGLGLSKRALTRRGLSKPTVYCPGPSKPTVICPGPSKPTVIKPIVTRSRKFIPHGELRGRQRASKRITSRTSSVTSRTSTQRCAKLIRKRAVGILAEKERKKSEALTAAVQIGRKGKRRVTPAILPQTPFPKSNVCQPDDVTIVPDDSVFSYDVTVIPVVSAEPAPDFSVDYIKDIMSYCLSLESRFSVPQNFLEKSPNQIKSADRQILLDWLLQVQVCERLSDDALHLAVALIDRYLTLADVTLDRFQLLGITCLLIATKYEDRYPPTVSRLLFLTMDTYEAADVKALERSVLGSVAFSLFVPTPTKFVPWLLKLLTAQFDFDYEITKRTFFLLDLSSTESRFSPVRPSVRAASAVYLSLSLHALTSRDPGDLSPEVKVSQLCSLLSCTTDDVIDCARDMTSLLLDAGNEKYKGVVEKYTMKGIAGAWLAVTMETIRLSPTFYLLQNGAQCF